VVIGCGQHHMHAFRLAVLAPPDPSRDDDDRAELSTLVVFVHRSIPLLQGVNEPTWALLHDGRGRDGQNGARLFFLSSKGRKIVTFARTHGSQAAVSSQ